MLISSQYTPKLDKISENKTQTRITSTVGNDWTSKDLTSSAFEKIFHSIAIHRYQGLDR